MAITMVGSKEGDGNGNSGVGQGTAMATTRAMAAATWMTGDKEDDVSRLEMYCTNVLIYCTMVLLVHLTKVTG